VQGEHIDRGEITASARRQGVEETWLDVLKPVEVPEKPTDPSRVSDSLDPL
jgi:hypothetical protein